MGSGLEIIERPQAGTLQKIHYLSGGDGNLFAMYIIDETNTGTLYYILTDHLGSPCLITDASGNTVQELSFDAWGKRRDPATWQPYATNATIPPAFIDRGFTFHEHLYPFTLINMNGRAYDPLVGRFLSPDPYIQAPDNTQNLNRYSYCLNNPLKYTDSSGEFLHLVIGAAIGGVMNWVMNGAEFSWEGLGYFGIGAAAGALGAGVEVGIQTASAGASFWAGFVGSSQGISIILSVGYTSSFANGALAGAGGGFAGCFGTGFGNGLMQGQSFGQAAWSGIEAGFWGGFSGALIGGLVGGLSAKADNRNFFTGDPPFKDVSLDIPYVSQDKKSMDCLLSNSVMLEEYYGGSRPIEDFRRILNSLPEGATVLDYYNAAGFEVIDPITISRLIEAMEVNKWPTTMLTIEGTIDGKQLHHNATITRVRMWTPSSKATFWVNDPIRGPNFKWTQSRLFKVLGAMFIISGTR